MQKLKEILCNNGWGTDKILKTLKNSDLQKCIKNCTSPNKKDIFNAFKGVKPEEVKVLIIGQDPYPDKKANGIAHGLSFSSDSTALPSSLKKIFEEITREFSNEKTVKFDTNNLTCWQDQKVLLLNTALTYCDNISLDKRVEAWKPFIDNIIKTILSSSEKPLVVMLWGKEAREAFINISELRINRKVLILNSSHPQAIGGNTFVNCNHFKECNKFLSDNNETGIDWWITHK